MSYCTVGSPLASCTQGLELRLDEATQENFIDTQFDSQDINDQPATEVMPEVGASPSDLLSSRADKRTAETDLSDAEKLIPTKQCKVEVDEEDKDQNESDECIILDDSKPKSIEVIDLGDSFDESQNKSSNSNSSIANEDQKKEQDITGNDETEIVTDDSKCQDPKLTKEVEISKDNVSLSSVSNDT